MKRFGAHDRNLRFDAETILRQRWSAEKLLLNGCLQCYNTWLWQMTHMLRLCGKSDAKKLQLVF